jgi:hypothetical protein
MKKEDQQLDNWIVDQINKADTLPYQAAYWVKAKEMLDELHFRSIILNNIF